MAKYEVECPDCGASYTVQLYGPGRDRDWKLENWDWTCDECKEKLRQKANQQAATANAEAGLPPLTGSEKQIAWAEIIRKQKIATLDEELSKHDLTDRIDKDRFNAALVNLRNKADAKWWIDNRDMHVNRMLHAEYAVTEKPLPQEEKKIAEEAKIEALVEATVRPEKPLTETVAEIRAGDTFVDVIFPEKREDFRQLVRFQLGYTWAETKWRRDLKSMNGPAHDRAAELGNRLLAAGFAIRIFDDILRVHAVSGNYEPESKRWVMARTSGQYKGWYAINWPKGDDFYQAAKRLHGARYDKPFVVVPAAQFQEVLDFAEMYQFSISDGAKKVIETAQSVQANALTTSVTPRKKEKLPEPGDKPAPLNVPDNIEIADEFKEGN